MKDIKRVQLSEIVELITKGTTPTTLGYEFKDEGVNFLKIECFDENGGFIESKVAHISEECHQKLKRSQLKIGDILFSIAGAIGRVAIVTEEMLPANTNQALAIIRISDEQVYLPYIKLILTSSIVIEQFERKKQGVAQLNLSLKDINELSIPLPSKDKQIELVEMFDKVGKVISKRNKELAALDPVSNPMGWQKVRLSKCLISIDNGKSFVCDAGYRLNEEPAVLKLSAVTCGYYKPEENKAMIEKKQFAENAEVHKGDLLFTRKNTPELVGMCAYVYDTPPKLMMPDIIFRLNVSECCNSIYLWKLINHDLFRSCIESIATGSAKSMSNISKGRLLGLSVILPPIELQQQFADFVAKVDKSKVAVQKALDETQLLFDSLMQEYFG